MVKDVFYAIRVLRKSPRFAFTAIAVLALGIGANSAMFTLVYSVLLRPLPYHDPGRIAVILGGNPQRGTFPLPPADFLDYRAGNRTFTDIAAAELWSPSLTGEGEAEGLAGIRTSTSLFDVFGVHAAAGRTFLPEDGRPGAPAVVVIGPGLWKRRFGGDPSVIGRRVLLNREPYTIAGVLPEGFYFPPFWGGKPEIFTPLAMTPARAQDRRISTLRLFARLKPEASWEQARLDVSAIAHRLASEYPEDAEKDGTAIPLAEISTGKVRTSLIVLFAAVGCILLIACANLANLFLARASGRRQEIAIRQALGAGRLPLIRQLLTESLMVSMAGGALGLVLALAAVRGFLAAVPGAAAFPRQSEIGIGLPVVLFTFAVCVATAIAFGLAPAVRATAGGLNHWLKQSARGSTGDRAGLRIRGLLIAGEIAIALVLLAGAGLLLQSFRHLRDIEPGFDPHHVLAISTSVGGSSHANAERRAAFYRDAVLRLRAIPGVREASAVNHAPMVGDKWTFNVMVEGRPAPRPGTEPTAIFRVAFPDYFRTIGMKIVRGRDFDERDREGAPRVVVINETMARRLWPGEDPIGKRFRTGDAEPAAVIGVLRDARQWVWSEPAENEMYFPFLQDTGYLHSKAGFLSMMLVVRTAQPPSLLAAAIREQLRALDRDVPVTAMENMEQVLTDAVWQQRMETSVLTGFAALALILAIVGIYAVMSYVVSGRTREIGIRMALGAGRAEVLRMVIAGSLRPVGLGLAVGIAAAAGVTRLMTNMLYGVAPADPGVLAAATILLGLVAIAAALDPARRAASVDPLIALRDE